MNLWHRDGGEYVPTSTCSLGGFGSPSGAYGSGGAGPGGSATVYAPTGQAAADTSLQGLADSLYGGYSSLQANPYRSDSQSSANLASGYGSGTAASTYPLTGQLTDYASNTVLPQSSQLTNYANMLQPYGQKVLDTAFDPQSAKYNRGYGQALDTANATSSMYGTASSPYGAGLASDALRSYDLDWQDRQLKRQEGGLTSASGLGTTLGTLAKDVGDLGYSAGTIGKQAGDIGAGAAKTEYTTGAYPYSTYGGYYTDLENYADPLIKDYESYLNTGQTASKTSGALGESGTKQAGSAVSGGVSALGGLGSAALNWTSLFKLLGI